MSSLAEIRAAVNEQERLNNRLKNELYALSSGVSNASNSWHNLTNYITQTLDTGTSRVIGSHERTVQAYELQCEIEEMYKLFKKIELANKKIRACKNKIYYDFGNYRAVRKIVQAMLNNIETSYVSDETLTKAVEVKHLQLPDYWLTCAMLSIMAWKKDDRKMAQKALERACKLDQKNTSIFFFAFHIRIGKDNVALKWFENYIRCARTGEDQENIMLMFSIINKTILESCNDELISKVKLFIDNLIKEDISRNGYSEDDIVNRIRHYLSAFTPNEPLNYALLSNYCTETEYLKSELMAAKSNASVLNWLLKVVNVTSDDKNDFLNLFIDDLISMSNKTEKDVTNEIKYNELIISHGGNVEAAKKEYDAWLRHNETDFEMVTELVDWIYHPDAVGMNPTIRQMMFKLTKNLNFKAIKRNVASYRKKYKTVLSIKINEYETLADFAKRDDECRKIDEYYNSKAETLLANEKIWSCFIGFGIAVLTLVGTIVLANPVFLVGTVAGVVAGIVKILLTNRKKQRIRKDCELAADSTKKTFLQLAEEFNAFDRKFREYDNYFNDIKAEFEKL